LRTVARAGTVEAVLAQVDAVGGHRRSLTPSVVTVLILGLCLFSGEGYSGVLGRLWPLLGTFNPGLLLGGPVSAVALSGARARLPVLRADEILVDAGTDLIILRDDEGEVFARIPVRDRFQLAGPLAGISAPARINDQELAEDYGKQPWPSGRPRVAWRRDR
jgi:hypothetical protein